MGHQHSSKRILLTIVALLVVLTGTTAGVIATTDPAETPHVSLTQSGANRFTQLSYQGQAGKSALALLKMHAAITTKDSPYGIYVVSINGVAANADPSASTGNYWMLYVNGHRAQQNAADYITKASDTITWKFE